MTGVRMLGTWLVFFTPAVAVGGRMPRLLALCLCLAPIAASVGCATKVVSTNTVPSGKPYEVRETPIPIQKMWVESDSELELVVGVDLQLSQEVRTIQPYDRVTASKFEGGTAFGVSMLILGALSTGSGVYALSGRDSDPAVNESGEAKEDVPGGVYAIGLGIALSSVGLSQLLLRILPPKEISRTGDEPLVTSEYVVWDSNDQRVELRDSAGVLWGSGVTNSEGSTMIRIRSGLDAALPSSLVLVLPYGTQPVGEKLDLRRTTAYARSRIDWLLEQAKSDTLAADQRVTALVSLRSTLPEDHAYNPEIDALTACWRTQANMGTSPTAAWDKLENLPDLTSLPPYVAECVEEAKSDLKPLCEAEQREIARRSRICKQVERERVVAGPRVFSESMVTALQDGLFRLRDEIYSISGRSRRDFRPLTDEEMEMVECLVEVGNEGDQMFRFLLDNIDMGVRSLPKRTSVWRGVFFSPQEVLLDLSTGGSGECSGRARQLLGSRVTGPMGELVRLEEQYEELGCEDIEP